MEARGSQDASRCFWSGNHLGSNSFISSQHSGISVKFPIYDMRMVGTRERDGLATEAHSASEFLLCIGGRVWDETTPQTDAEMAQCPQNS